MALAEEYFAAEGRPAETTLDYRKEEDRPYCSPSLADDDRLLDGRAFVIRNVLSSQECDEWIRAAEEAGVHPPSSAVGTLRTAKRTSNYQNPEFSELITQRLQESNVLTSTMLSAEEDKMGEFYGIHSNWRIVRYDQGDSFCAHQDQMDSMQVFNNKDNGSKDFIVSSHTLLIQLTQNTDGGGATRFYPHSKVKTSQPGQYDTAVDVFLPRGWAICFRQQGLIHAGQPVVSSEPKYVAQAGILRKPPPTTLLRPSVFRLGPGLEAFRDSNRGVEISRGGRASSESQTAY